MQERAQEEGALCVHHLLEEPEAQAEVSDSVLCGGFGANQRIDRDRWVIYGVLKQELNSGRENNSEVSDRRVERSLEKTTLVT
jgi:hypothetical protein